MLKYKPMTKMGVVLIVGRPNVGKSTLLNNLLRQKVSITSPRPQTTRFPLEAVYEDERGQIIFVDTPGIFNSTPDKLSKTINASVETALDRESDVILYMIDPTRPRDSEENKILGMVRKIKIPKILAINKIDLPQTHSAEYAFYEDEFPVVIKISAQTHANLNKLLDEIFSLLLEKSPLIDTAKMVQPALNLDSKTFIAEIIREKIFLNTHDEVPYTVNTYVEQIKERRVNQIYIKAKIITTNEQYKKMLIGRHGIMIKEIGMAVRKELEAATGKKIYIDLTVEVNADWQETWNPT